MKFYRKVIRIRATDSPNVQLALAEIAAGLKPSGKILVPGVLTYDQYKHHLATWDIIQRTVKLDGEFYEGSEVLLFPPEWLNRAHEIARTLRGKRQALAIGIDSGQGSANTSMAAVDKLGLIELVSRKTPDTSRITGEALAFMRKHNVPPDKVFFDRGGGGLEHADRLRSQGYPVQTVAFGESVVLEPKRGVRLFGEKLENREEKYAYRNRRAEMYGIFSELLDPVNSGFGIPDDGPVYQELRRQLAVMPKDFDEEGRMYLPPKNKRDKDSKKQTLTDMLGCSPDEADAVVLAVYGMTVKRARAKVVVF